MSLVALQEEPNRTKVPAHLRAYLVGSALGPSLHLSGNRGGGGRTKTKPSRWQREHRARRRKWFGHAHLRTTSRLLCVSLARYNQLHFLLQTHCECLNSLFPWTARASSWCACLCTGSISRSVASIRQIAYICMHWGVTDTGWRLRRCL